MNKGFSKQGEFFFKKIDNKKLYLAKLTKHFAVEHSKELLSLINIIPFIDWTTKDLLKDYEILSKWETSFVILNKEKRIIAVLIAYFRLADNKHIFDSLYIHKLAVIPEYQKKGIGSSLLSYFCNYFFYNIKWLLNISVQTNLNSENRNVIKFYNKNGFVHQYNIKYTNKIDTLLLLSRDNISKITKPNENISLNIDLSHPRVSYDIELFNYSKINYIPTVFFSTSNKRKKELYKYIFSNYNIHIEYIKPKIQLTEPQIDDIAYDEQNLVSHPLKVLSRFITKTPFAIEDTMFFIEFFNKDFNNPELPGHDTKRWWRQLSNSGILEIMGKTKKRRAKFVSQVGAYLGKGMYIFGRGETHGTISCNERRNTQIENQAGTYPYFFHSIFIPENSSKTLSEMDIYEYAQFDYKRKSIIDFINKLKQSYFFKPEIKNLFNNNE